MGRTLPTDAVGGFVSPRFTDDGPTRRWTVTFHPPAPGKLLAFSGALQEERAEIEQLINVSTRTPAPFTAGFVIVGDKPKPVLVRGVGPTLGTKFNVPGALSSVFIDVFRNGKLIASGTDWSTSSAAAEIMKLETRVGAFSLPLGSKDAALALNLEPGDYTVRVRGQNGASGVALAEVYDATEGAISRSRRIVNVSTLADAGTGSATLISGFVVNGSVPKRVLIRAVGPSLTPFGVSQPLKRPLLSIYKGEYRIARNEGWRSAGNQAILEATFRQVGAFGFLPDSDDAALLTTLEPGAYTAQVTGAEGETGAALVEVYELP